MISTKSGGNIPTYAVEASQLWRCGARLSPAPGSRRPSSQRGSGCGLGGSPLASRVGLLALAIVYVTYLIHLGRIDPAFS